MRSKEERPQKFILMTHHYPNLGSASDWLKNCFIRWEALLKSGLWHVVSMEFLRSFLRRHFAGAPVVASWNVVCFLRLSHALVHLNHSHHHVIPFKNPSSSPRLQYFKLLKLFKILNCFLLCVFRPSVKKEILKRMVFLLLPSLSFSQFWKLGIKQVCIN